MVEFAHWRLDGTVPLRVRRLHSGLTSGHSKRTLEGCWIMVERACYRFSTRQASTARQVTAMGRNTVMCWKQRMAASSLAGDAPIPSAALDESSSYSQRTEEEAQLRRSRPRLALLCCIALHSIFQLSNCLLCTARASSKQGAACTGDLCTTTPRGDGAQVRCRKTEIFICRNIAVLLKTPVFSHGCSV